MRKKFEPKAVPCLFLGLHSTIKGALLLPLDGKQITVTAVFTVNEGHFPLKLDQVATPSTLFIKQHGSVDVRSLPVHWPIDDHKADPALRDPRMELPDPIRVSTRPPPRDRAPSAQCLENIATEADRRIAAGSDKEVLAFAPTPTTRQEYLQATPSTTRQAEASAHRQFWSWARKREVIAHVKNQTLGPLLDKPPAGFKVLTTSFVYKNKYVGEEAIRPEDLPATDWKARMVVKGYLMIEGSDYVDTFAPTASPTSVRLLAALASRLKYPIMAADFETAFLNSDMDTTVYVSTPSGYEAWARYSLEELLALPADFLPPQEAEPAGCRLLLKGVPGIKQGSRLFYLKIKNFLLEKGYSQLPADPCVYFRVSEAGLTLFAIWVDDVIAMVPNFSEWAALVACVRTVFAFSDKGPISLFLGIDFVQSKDYSMVSLCQHKSTTDLLQRAGMEVCNPAPTPD